MKALLWFALVDTVVGIVLTIGFFTLKHKADSVTEFLSRKAQGKKPFEVNLRELLQMLAHMRNLAPLARNAPEWAKAQGLTIYEELQVHRHWREALLREVGTDEIWILKVAMGSCWSPASSSADSGAEDRN